MPIIVDIDVMLARRKMPVGGLGVARALLAADLVDRLHVGIAPIVLGRGGRFWDDLRRLEEGRTVTTEVAESGVIHVTIAR